MHKVNGSAPARGSVVLVENVVQGTARDLLAPPSSASRPAAGRSCSIATTRSSSRCREGAVSEQEVLALLLEPPAWAAGSAARRQGAQRRALSRGAGDGRASTPQTDAEIAERAVDAFVADATRLPDTMAVERGAEETSSPASAETLAPAHRFGVAADEHEPARVVSVPRRSYPSCNIYPDHYHCFGCGARGDRLDWLTQVEGMTRDEAMAALYDWAGPATAGAEAERRGEARLRAPAFGTGRCRSAGTIGERYLSETRGIDVDQSTADNPRCAALPPELRLRCGDAVSCIIALMRDPVTDAPVGIHRIGLAQENGAITKIDRKALGHMGVVKLWPATASSSWSGKASRPCSPRRPASPIGARH